MDSKPVVVALKAVLADNYMLYLKTQNYHWNVEGVRFKYLHLMFEEQYQELAVAIDTIAELIRGLGAKAPATFGAYSENTILKPGDECATAEQMLVDLHNDQVAIAQTLHKALKAAQDSEDEVVAGFLIERLTVHRKTAWMLKSSM